MSHRSVIISDVHLGCAGGVEVEQLRPIWQGADELIINGDLAEMHHPDYRAHAGWAVLELTNLCEYDGVELTLIAGNHDPYVSSCRHLVRGGGQVLITHGDVLHPSIAPWCPTSRQVEQEYFHTASFLAPASRMNLETRLALTAHAAHHSWQEHVRGSVKLRTSAWSMARHPWHAVRLLHFWAIVPMLAARLAEQHVPEARFICIGHTHLQGVWRKLDRTVINTGCFTMPGKPQAVVLEPNRLGYHRIVRDRDGTYRLSRRAKRAFELEPFDMQTDRDGSDDATATNPLKFPGTRAG